MGPRPPLVHPVQAVFNRGHVRDSEDYRQSRVQGLALVRSLPESVLSTSQRTRILVNSQLKMGEGSSTQVLRGRDVRNSLWETGWTLPRSVGIGADQV